MTINKIREALELIEGVTDYLDGNHNLNSIQATSMGHNELLQARDLLKALELDIDVEVLRTVIEGVKPRYEDALKYYETSLSGFCGMNKDKPKKSPDILLFEYAAKLLTLYGGE